MNNDQVMILEVLYICDEIKVDIVSLASPLWKGLSQPYPELEGGL